VSSLDLVKLFDDAVQTLPTGDYSTGLSAIVRHVRAAIRHLERDQEDSDSCTDVIYRTNQAYEGSLKEAYRVLAAKDPSGLSPFQIEGYLETHSVVRPRVLTQLSRYRQDYRNPSTHDYKLDFDKDEALLAIVSVCGFALLLVNQISSRLASEAAQAKAVIPVRVSPRANLRSLGKKISEICLAFTKESHDVAFFEYEKGISQSLVNAGFDSEYIDSNDEGGLIWDVIVRRGRSYFGIDVRVSHHGGADMQTGGHLGFFMDANCSGALLIIRNPGIAEYTLFSGEVSEKEVFIICENDKDQINLLQKNIANFREVTK